MQRKQALIESMLLTLHMPLETLKVQDSGIKQILFELPSINLSGSNRQVMKLLYLLPLSVFKFCFV
jgi:hypothetical protein